MCVIAGGSSTGTRGAAAKPPAAHPGHQLHAHRMSPRLVETPSPPPTPTPHCMHRRTYTHTDPRTDTYRHTFTCRRRSHGHTHDARHSQSTRSTQTQSHRQAHTRHRAPPGYGQGHLVHGKNVLGQLAGGVPVIAGAVGSAGPAIGLKRHPLAVPDGVQPQAGGGGTVTRGSCQCPGIAAGPAPLPTDSTTNAG